MTALAFQGPLSGQFAWVGDNLVAAARLALADAARDGWLPGAVDLRTFDTAGGGDAAEAAARAIAADPEIVGVVGPAFSGETERSGDAFDAASLAFVLPVATKPELGARGWRGFFRLVASDATRAPLTARLIAERLGVRAAGVVSDGPASQLAGLVAEALRAVGVEVVHLEQVERGDADAEAVAARLDAAGAGGVYFAGEYPEAAALRRALLARQRRALPFVADDGVLTPAFVEAAGADAAADVWVTFPGADPATAPDGFADRFRAVAAADPRAFAVEGHQAATVLLRALAAAGPDRAGIVAFLHGFDGDVAGRRVAFTPAGETASQTFFAYRVHDGAWRQELELTDGDAGAR